MAASTVMAYSAVEAPASSRITLSRVRRSRFMVRDMVSSFSSGAVGTARGAAGAAGSAAAVAATRWQPQLPAPGPGDGCAGRCPAVLALTRCRGRR